MLSLIFDKKKSEFRKVSINSNLKIRIEKISNAPISLKNTPITLPLTFLTRFNRIDENWDKITENLNESIVILSNFHKN